MEANEYIDFEDRRYVNPTISRDEQMAFIDNLRNTQTANNEQIQTDTYNLGTHIPATQGGLATGATSPDSYFMQRYQTPQVDSQVAALKATAQAQALNDVLSNYQKQVKKRYSDAYRAYNKRKNTYSPTTNPTNPTNPTGSTDPNENPLDKTTQASTNGGQITTDPWEGRNTTSYVQDGVWITVDTDTGEVLRRNSGSNGSSSPYSVWENLRDMVAFGAGTTPTTSSQSNNGRGNSFGIVGGIIR